MRLPDKLWQLAQAALVDVRACEAQPDVFVINMYSWCSWSSKTPRCSLCAAGAVMVHTLDFKKEIDGPDHILELFGVKDGRSLLAIDMLRRGNVGRALAIKAGLSWNDAQDRPETHPISRSIPIYYGLVGGAEWHAGMQSLINDLKEADL